MATSFAMVLDTSVEEVFKYTGHDGSAIVFPNLNDPHCRRGHTTYEMVLFALSKGYGVTPLSPRYTHESLVSGQQIEVFLDSALINKAYLQTDMVLLGQMPNGDGHAMAWSVDDRIVYCPSGYSYPRETNPMSVELMLLCSPLKWPLTLSWKPANT
jgi:hypothetical protein